MFNPVQSWLRNRELRERADAALDARLNETVEIARREADSILLACREMRTSELNLVASPACAPRWGRELHRPWHGAVLEAAERGESIPMPPGVRGSAMDPWGIQRCARDIAAEYGYTYRPAALPPEEP